MSSPETTDDDDPDIGNCFDPEMWHDMAHNQASRPASARFTEHPETIEGDVSNEFINFLLHVHPSQPYSSADTAKLCRYAYDLGRKETVK